MRSLFFLALGVFLVACMSDRPTIANPDVDDLDLDEHAPTLASVNLYAGPFTVGSTIQVRLGKASDPDGDTVAFKYQWYVNGVPEAGAVDEHLAGVFIRGDEVYVEVTPHDGATHGTSVASETVTIENSPPVIATASLGAGPYRQADTITGTATGFDADGDAFWFSFRWFIAGAYVATGSSFAGAFAKGDVVTAEVMPHDGIDAGTPVAIAPITIQDTPPSVVSIHVESGMYTDTNQVAVSVSAVDADGEAVQLHYRWFDALGPLSGATSPVLSGVFPKGTTVAAEVRPEAGGVFGAPWSSTVTIPNSPPIMASLDLGAGPHFSGDTLTVIAAATDADDDDITYAYRWFINDAEILGSTELSLTGLFTAGDTIVVEVTPNDGTEDGATVAASTTIANTPPSAPGVSLYPEKVTGLTRNMWATIATASTDPDGHPLTYAYAWYRNGTLQGFAASQTLVTAAYIKEGDVWRVEAVAHDGTDDSLPGWAERSVITEAVQIVAGGAHTCALTVAGGVKCWGSNAYGQLGNGDPDLDYQVTPVAVSGLSTGIKSLSAGGGHTCALTTAGEVLCWGNNQNGQLGNGESGYALIRNTPVPVAALAGGVVAIAAGGGHTCALTAAGGVKCWGYAYYGQLGNGDTTLSASPVDVSGLLEGVTAIAAGSEYSCAVTAAGGAKCWGDNAGGQLGDGTTVKKLTPVDVSGLSTGVTAISASSRHTCAQVSGGVKCWGTNTDGQLGNGTLVDQHSPVDVMGISGDVQAIATGYTRSCALTDGGMKCWGSNVGSAPSSQKHTTAVDVIAPGSGVRAMGLNSHSCAVYADGAIKCWGENQYGQLGNGSTWDSLEPVDVDGLTSGVNAISAAIHHTCALMSTGAINCWGWNGYGQLGNSSLDSQYAAVAVTGLTSGVSIMAAGGHHTCIVTSLGAVKCWGSNRYGQLGIGALSPPATTPVDVSGLSIGAQAVASGMDQSCAVVNGAVKCWGRVDYPQIGVPSVWGAQLSAAEVTGFTSGVVAIAGGEYHACAVTRGGGVKCWGYDDYGQLGDGGMTTQLSAVDVTGLTSGVHSITLGDNHSCALTTSGGVKCWGDNSYGQLGAGLLAADGLWASATPVDVVGLANDVVSISSGEFHTCALTVAGAVKCWGYNESGQLGDGVPTLVAQPNPLNVNGLQTDIVAVAAGARHTCALTLGGGVKCWGNNGSGQLGKPSLGLTPYRRVVGFGP